MGKRKKNNKKSRNNNEVKSKSKIEIIIPSEIIEEYEMVCELYDNTVEIRDSNYDLLLRRLAQSVTFQVIEEERMKNVIKWYNTEMKGVPLPQDELDDEIIYDEESTEEIVDVCSRLELLKDTEFIDLLTKYDPSCDTLESHCRRNLWSIIQLLVLADAELTRISLYGYWYVSKKILEQDFESKTIGSTDAIADTYDGENGDESHAVFVPETGNEKNEEERIEAKEEPKVAEHEVEIINNAELKVEAEAAIEIVKESELELELKAEFKTETRNEYGQEVADSESGVQSREREPKDGIQATIEESPKVEMMAEPSLNIGVVVMRQDETGARCQSNSIFDKEIAMDRPYNRNGISQDIQPNNQSRMRIQTKTWKNRKRKRKIKRRRQRARLKQMESRTGRTVRIWNRKKRKKKREIMKRPNIIQGDPQQFGGCLKQVISSIAESKSVECVSVGAPLSHSSAANTHSIPKMLHSGYFSAYANASMPYCPLPLSLSFPFMACNSQIPNNPQNDNIRSIIVSWMNLAARSSNITMSKNVFQIVVGAQLPISSAPHFAKFSRSCNVTKSPPSSPSQFFIRISM